MRDEPSEGEDWAEYHREHPEPSNVFVRAAASGDIETVRRMLGEGAEVDQPDMGFETEYGSTSDMRAPNTFGATALEMAARTRNLEMLKLLYEAGANPAPRDPWHEDRAHSVIGTAIRAGFVEGVRYLVDEQGLALKDEEERSDAWLLVSAIGEEGSVDMLRYLVEEKGLDLREKTENGVTSAARANDRSTPPEFLEYIYSKGGVPSGTQHIWPKMKLEFAESAKKDLENLTGDDFSSLEGAMKFMERYTGHSTLLNGAVFNGNIEKVRIHLKYGADPLEKDDKGVDALGVLARLKTARSVFGYWEEHEEIESLINDALEARRRNAPKGPAPQ